MSDSEVPESGPSWAMRVLAVVVLAIAAWILLKVVIHVVFAVASVVVVIGAIVGLVWAYRTLSSS